MNTWDLTACYKARMWNPSSMQLWHREVTGAHQLVINSYSVRKGLAIPGKGQSSVSTSFEPYPGDTKRLHQTPNLSSIVLVPSRQDQRGVPIRLGRLERRAGSGQAAFSGGCYIQNEDLNPGSQNEGLFSMFTYNTVMLLTKNNAATWVYCSQNNYRIYKEKRLTPGVIY